MLGRWRKSLATKRALNTWIELSNLYLVRKIHLKPTRIWLELDGTNSNVPFRIRASYSSVIARCQLTSFRAWKLFLALSWVDKWDFMGGSRGVGDGWVLLGEDWMKVEVKLSRRRYYGENAWKTITLDGVRSGRNLDGKITQSGWENHVVMACDIGRGAWWDR